MSSVTHLKFYKNTELPVVSHEDKDLIKLILADAHSTRVGYSLNPIHLTKRLTNINTKRGAYGVFITRTSNVIKTYVNNCTQCRKRNSETLVAREGNLFSLENFEKSMGLFIICQIDIIGPYSTTVFKETRGTKHLKI